MDPYGRPQPKQTSPWVYIGLGCGVAVLIALAGIVGFTYLVYRQGKQMTEGFRDPKIRESKTREVIAYDNLPPGYYAGGAMSIPFLMDFAVLSDREPKAGESPDQGGFNERSFIFMNMRHLRQNREKMERYLRGEAPPPEESPWGRSNVNFNTKEVIRRGELQVGGQKILYQASRGEVNHRQNKENGVVTMILPECPDDRLRFGVWIGPAPAGSEGKPANEVDYKGTPADPAALQDFLGHFRLCGGKV
jgi:hypothetical protein